MFSRLSYIKIDLILSVFLLAKSSGVIESPSNIIGSLHGKIYAPAVIEYEMKHNGIAFEPVGSKVVLSGVVK